MWAYRIRQSGLSLYSRLSLAVGIGYSVSSLGANILLTILIIVRLLLYRRSVMKALPVDYTKHYLSLATIVIESVLPYSLFGAGFIITYAINNPLYRIFLYLSSTCQVRRPPVICTWYNCAIALSANRGFYDYIKSRSRTRVDYEYASFGNDIYQCTFQSAGLLHPRHR